jgi:putative transposase
MNGQAPQGRQKEWVPMADTFTNLLVHVIFSTKHRAPLIAPGFRERLYEYVGGIIRKEGGTLLEIGGMPDHLHLLARFKADRSVADMVRSTKSSSTKWIHGEFSQQNEFAWQVGYGAFSVSESQVSVVRRYIRNQEEHHARVSFKDELIGFLGRNRMEFDERYLFD